MDRPQTREAWGFQEALLPGAFTHDIFGGGESPVLHPHVISPLESGALSSDPGVGSQATLRLRGSSGSPQRMPLSCSRKWEH